MAEAIRPLAVITGASTGIGFEWAKCCARNNYDLIIADSGPGIRNTAIELSNPAIKIEPVEVDLSTPEGVDTLYSVVKGRHVAALLANTTYDLHTGFLEEDFSTWRKTLDRSLTSALYLVQKIARDMAAAKAGLILITGSLGEQQPGSYHSLYNGIKAFLDSFVFALRHELKDKGITITCLMPGDEAGFMKRAKELEEKEAAQAKKDPFDLVESGLRDMMKGETEVLQGWQNIVQTAISSFAPAQAEQGLESGLTQAQEPINSSQRGVYMTTQQQYGETQSGASRSEYEGRPGGREYGGSEETQGYEQARFSDEGGTGRSAYTGAADESSRSRSAYGASRGGGSSRSWGERDQYGRGEEAGRSRSGSRGGQYEEDDYGYAEEGSRRGAGGGRSGGYEGSESPGGYESGGAYGGGSSGGGYGGRSGGSRYGREEDDYEQDRSRSRRGGGYAERNEYDEDMYSESGERMSRRGRGYEEEEEESSRSERGRGYGRGSYGSRAYGEQGGSSRYEQEESSSDYGGGSRRYRGGRSGYGSPEEQGGASRYGQGESSPDYGSGRGSSSGRYGYGSQGGSSGSQSSSGQNGYGKNQGRSSKSSFGCCGTSPKDETCGGGSSSCDYEPGRTSRFGSGSGSKSGSSTDADESSEGGAYSRRSSSSGSGSGR